ncbi:hypothetical protein [Methylobacillus sp.]|uniref:hypothetical protein n=1 Tax=Methylobacillus sp. TaxID=56818 RepID=UPI002FE380BE
MAAPWLAVVLKNVPWGEVIRRAPDIADGARKLWQSVSGKQDYREPKVYDVPYSELESTSERDARIQSLEMQIARLQTQMVESSQLIKTLADQNEQLIARVESNRRQVAKLSRVVLGLVIGLIAVAVWVWRLAPLSV